MFSAALSFCLNASVPLLAMVPKFSSISSLLMPQPLSAIVSVRAAASGDSVIAQSVARLASVRLL